MHILGQNLTVRISNHIQTFEWFGQCDVTVRLDVWKHSGQLSSDQRQPSRSYFNIIITRSEDKRQRMRRECYILSAGLFLLYTFAYPTPPWPFHLIHHSCWPFTARSIFQSYITHPRSSGYWPGLRTPLWPGQNCKLSDCCRKTKAFSEIDDYWSQIFDSISMSIKPFL